MELEKRITEAIQRDHYDAIAEKYEMHYADRFSREYMRDFFFVPMTQDIDLTGLRVLDAMCGNGPTVGFLQQAGADVVGLDISPQVLSAFRKKWPGCETVEGSIFGSQIADSSFDGVFIIGGLHHLHPYVEHAIDEIYRILKPGGFFCFSEPHVGSLPDRIRQVWYRVDPLFARNEMGIDVEHLETVNHDRFEVTSRRYLGGIAYLFVLNSLVFRVPPWLKPYYARIACTFEAVCNRFIGRRTACYVTCQWRKRGVEGGQSLGRPHGVAAFEEIVG